MMDWELISDEMRTSTLIFSYICTIFFHRFLYFPATAHVFFPAVVSHWECPPPTSMKWLELGGKHVGAKNTETSLTKLFLEVTNLGIPCKFKRLIYN